LFTEILFTFLYFRSKIVYDRHIRHKTSHRRSGAFCPSLWTLYLILFRFFPLVLNVLSLIGFKTVAFAGLPFALCSQFTVHPASFLFCLHRQVPFSLLSALLHFEPDMDANGVSASGRCRVEVHGTTVASFNARICLLHHLQSRFPRDSPSPSHLFNEYSNSMCEASNAVVHNGPCGTPSSVATGNTLEIVD
jgi:hypothetical protein